MIDTRSLLWLLYRENPPHVDRQLVEWRNKIQSLWLLVCLRLRKKYFFHRNVTPTRIVHMSFQPLFSPRTEYMYSTRNVILDIFIVFYCACILSYRAYILSYRSCILSYRVCILSYRVSGFPFSIVFCVYQVFRLSWKSFIVWLRSLWGVLWIIFNEKVQYSLKALFVLSKKLFLGMFVCLLRFYVPIKNFWLIWRRFFRIENDNKYKADTYMY
jgi:hypothetical protein